MYDKNNIFAKIIRKKLPCEIVYENDFILVFKDINPKRKVHLLAIPKGEYIDYTHFISKATEKEVYSFWKGVKDIAIQETNSSYKLETNIGSLSGQEVFHFHIHILSNDVKNK